MTSTLLGISRIISRKSFAPKSIRGYIKKVNTLKSKLAYSMGTIGKENLLQKIEKKTETLIICTSN